MTRLEAMCAAYWNAFREGFFKVGGRPEEYPDWAHAPAAVKEETRRCMRYAAETLSGQFTDGLWEDLFPEKLVKRGQPMMPNDQAFVQQTRLGELQERLK